ncbi:MAG: pyridoxal phosphate-dependent aminotransferase [Deltaproteobacteria bacterium]|nr:pyridoxal phosphate-dependent aminotransferase [Deltaproteobacteria bacterium]
MIQLSKRVQGVQPSATLGMAAKAKALAAAGHRVISFATGEPDFDTPLHIKEAAKKALDRGMTKYVQVGGIPELIAAVQTKLKRDNHLDYTKEEIIITCGAKDAIFTTLLVLLNEGDEVIIPAPYWVSFPEQVKIAGGAPKIVTTDATRKFRLTPKQLEASITPKSRVVILNSPCNPTGSAYPRDELAALVDIAVNHNLVIISDEIYEKLIYGNFTHTSVATLSDKARASTITVNGVSKTYAMTGWRMGFAAGPKEVIDKMKTVQGQQISSITSFIQPACAEAFLGPQDDVKKMVKEFATRRDLMHEQLTAIPKITAHLPEGAFFHFPNVQYYLGKRSPNGPVTTDADLAEYLLEQAHVAVVGGSASGAPGYIRLSYATSREDIEEGIKKIKDALEKLT